MIQVFGCDKIISEDQKHIACDILVKGETDLEVLRVSLEFKHNCAILSFVISFWVVTVFETRKFQLRLIFIYLFIYCQICNSILDSYIFVSKG